MRLLGKSIASVTTSSGLFFIALCAFLTGAIPARAAGCVVAARDLGGVKGAPIVSSTSCDVGTGSTDKFHLTFLRLNEVLAGTLAMGEVVPEIVPFFGDKGLVANAVGQEVQSIFKRFGRKQVYDWKSFQLVMNARGVSRSELEWRSFEVRPQKTASEIRRLWTITHAVDTLETRYPIYDARASRIIYSTDRWPQDFKMFYECSTRPIFECVTLWRFLSPADLDILARDTEADDKKRATADPDPGIEAQEPASETRINVSDWPIPNSHRLHFEFFKYLARGGWHPKLAYYTIDTTMKSCTHSITTAYLTRPMALDVALVENASDQRITINALLASNGLQTGLRPTNEDNARQSAPVSLPSDTALDPGQKAVIPLRIVLLDPTQGMDVAELNAISAEMHRKVQTAKPRELEFQVFEDGEERKGNKRANSYRAPELPSLPELIYGPSLRLNGLTLLSSNVQVSSGASEVALTRGTFRFDKGDESFQRAPEVHLVQNGSPGGSCPFLSIWDEAEKTWILHGKVIDGADSPEKEKSQQVRFDGDIRFVRLTEDEPEDAYIRDVRLIREFADGAAEEVRGTARRAGGQRVSTKPLGMAAKIPSFSHVDFEFPPPHEGAGKVRASSVVVSGYYIRNSDMHYPRIVRRDQ